MTDVDFTSLPYRPCVGLMIVNGDGMVFAGRRIDGGKLDEPDAWQMPQGGVDPGEDVETAALREMGEETGLRPQDVSIIRRAREDLAYDLPAELMGKLWGGRYRGQKQTWFAVRLLSPDSAINIATDEPEFNEWAWMTPDQIIEKIVPFKLHVYRAVFTEFSDVVGKNS